MKILLKLLKLRFEINAFIVCCIFLLACSNCQSIKEKPDDRDVAGKYHTVKRGDTLAKLAKTYRIPKEEIMETNGIEDERHLTINRILFMPDPDPIGQKIGALVKNQSKTVTRKLETGSKPVNFRLFDFPVRDGTIIYHFSKAKGRPYDGIGIKSELGAPIFAPLDGKVLFSGDDGTKFGLIVILEHQEPFITVYAHLRSSTVKAGQLIKRGQMLAAIGTSGGVEIPHLHFQIRVNRRPEDPKLYLKETR